MSQPGINWCLEDVLSEGAFRIFEAGGFQSAVLLSISGPGLALELHRRYPAAHKIGRLYCGGDQFPSDDDLTWWDWYIEQVGDAIEYFQIDNESDERCPTVMPEQYALYWREIYRHFKAIYPQKKFGFPMPSIKGEQSWEYAKRCRVAIEAADWAAERGYWQEEWQMEDWNWGKRYQRTHFEFPDKEIHLAEYGCSAELSEDERAKQYRRFAESLPAYIRSHNVFIMRPAPTWTVFEVDENLARAMRMEGPTMDDSYSIGPGMFEAMDRNADSPVEDEHYVGDSESWCSGEKGSYMYSLGANRVSFSPFV